MPLPSPGGGPARPVPVHFKAPGWSTGFQSQEVAPQTLGKSREQKRGRGGVRQQWGEGLSSLALETPGMLPRQRQEAVGRPLSPPYLVPHTTLLKLKFAQGS